MNQVNLVLIICTNLLMGSMAFARPYAGLITPMAAADSASVAGANPAGIVRFEEASYQMELLARYRQINFFRSEESSLQVSSNHPTPFAERTNPEIPIVFSPDQMSAKVE